MYSERLCVQRLHALSAARSVVLLLVAVCLVFLGQTAIFAQTEPPPSGPVPCPVDTYQKFLASRKGTLKCSPAAASTPPSLLRTTNLPRVAVIVNNTLYPQIETRLNTYVSDIRFEGYEVEVYRFVGGTAEDIRALLQSRYENGKLVGCVLIGALPYALFEMEYEFALNSYVAYPTDVFLMDLDAQWLDTNPFPTAQPLVYDGYVNGAQQGLEIFVGRIDASNLDPYGFDYEVQRTNAYLDKAHAWHTYTMPRAVRQLTYFEGYGELDGYPPGDRVEHGNATDYLARICRDPATRTDAYEMVRVVGHGCPWGAYVGDSGWVGVESIRALGPKAQFYNLAHCQISWFNYQQGSYHGCVGNYYIFADNNSTALATIGCTKVTFPADIIWYLASTIAQHKTMGEGFKQGFQIQAPFQDYHIYDLFGYVLLGDPMAMPFPPPMHVRPDGDDSRNGYTWDTAKRTIAGAIAALAPNMPDGEIWVAAGTYNERLTFSKPIKLYGGFAGTEESLEQRNWAQHVTVIDGQGGDVITIPNRQSSTSRVDGFTIRNSMGSGRGIVSSSSPLVVENDLITANSGSTGGGVFASSTSLTIANSTITGNSATYGGAVYCTQCTGAITSNVITQNTSSSGAGGIHCQASGMAITGNTFTANSGAAGAIMCMQTPAPTITDSTFTGNTGASWAGAIHCEGSSAAVSNCTITGNTGQYRGGGVSCYGCSPTVSVSTIAGNSAWYGSGVYCESAPASLTNNIVKNNTGNCGTGVYCYLSNAAITNNTIVDNVGQGYSYCGGLCVSYSSPTVRNNIFAFNACGVCNLGGGTPILSNNNVFYNNIDYWMVDPGPGDIYADPMFNNRLLGDVRIRTGSACIDAGTNDGAPAVDFDGFHRPFDGDGDNVETCDMGAYEVRRIYVKADSPGPVLNGRSWSTAFHTIQEGLNAADYNAEVWVAEGTYNEAVTMKNGIRLYGGFGGTELTMGHRNPSAHVTRITGGGNDRAVTMESLNDTVTRIDGFTIANSKAGGMGIYANGSGGVIENNVISGNSGGGIRAYEVDSPALLVIARNTVTGNHSDEYGGGIHLDSSNTTYQEANITVVGNIIRGNTAQYGAGICSYECDDGARISSNTISDNVASSSGGGIYMYVSDPTCENNIITWNSVYGVSSYYGGCNPIELPLRNNDVYGNTPSGYYEVTPGPTDISQDPGFVDRAGGDLHLNSDSPCIDVGCNDARGQLAMDIDGQGRIAGTVDIGADEYLIMHVATTGNDSNNGYSWTQAKRTIQNAVNTAGDRAEVWVKAGTYAEHVTMKSGIQLFGGFAGNETRRSQRNWATNVTTINCGDGGDTITMSMIADPFTTVDGFTIRSNAANAGRGFYCNAAAGSIANNTIINNKGGGIYCENGSDLSVTANVVTGSDSCGGIHADNSTIRVIGNTITGNHESSSYYGGGGILTVMADATIANNILSGNASGVGGAVHCLAGNPVITGNTVTGNSAPYAGAFYISNVFGGDISGNRISGNTSDKGGGIYTTSSATLIRNNLVFGNTGGGVYLEDCGDSQVINNTIVDNIGYGGIYSEMNGNPVYRNNLVAFNQYGIYNGLFGDCRADPILSNNDVFGSTIANYSYVSPGPGDISKNPFFVKRNQADYHVKAKSPCIDAGTNTVAPTSDLDGRPRPIDGDGNGSAICDIGVYERPTDLAGAIGHSPNGSRIDLASVSVTACLSGFDAAGINWVYVENTDRVSGIRVRTDKTFSLNQLVTVSGTIQTDTNTGERYIQADSTSPVQDGGTCVIGAIGMGNRWLGGRATGYEPTIKDGIGLYNVGLLVQSWGWVTYSSSVGRFFYINDGSCMRDGSPYVGVKVVVPAGVTVPAVNSFVKVKGISGASLISPNFVRTLRARSQSDITTILSWLNSPVPLTRGIWNALSLPGIPAYPTPESVFWGLETGIQLGGYLKYYDALNQQWVIHGEACAVIPWCETSDGYMLYIPPDGASNYVYDRTPAEGDQAIGLPTGSETPVNFSLVGNPFDAAVPWSSCMVTDGSWTGTISEAVECGFIHRVCYWAGYSWCDVTDLSTGSMSARTAYQIYPRYSDLAVIVPAQQ